MRNIVIRLTAKHAGNVVSAGDLAAEFDTLNESSPASPTSHSDLVSTLSQEIQENPGFSLDTSLRRWEQAYIEAAQRIAHGNISQAARILGLNRTTLYNRMEALSRNSAETQ
ncbi:helix-turn-helix domain-containing protein [Georgfuchsia toluolica]|uniref:helix-turn-helix domain-containing protein n=1 Tax=Georgfuchsia toluolica TaxID=424218 RepID=UPI0031B89E76